MSNESLLAFWVEAWTDAYQRLAGCLWNSPPPEPYLRKVEYCYKRMCIALEREAAVKE